MRRKTKAFVQLTFGLFLSVCTLLVGWSMLKESDIDVADTTTITGAVTKREVGKNFSFRLSGSPRVFNVYRPSRTYDDLLAELSPGDSVTVCYLDSQTAGTRVVQIEKKGRMVVDKALLTGQNRTGGVLGLLGGFALLGLAIWQFNKQTR